MLEVFVVTGNKLLNGKTMTFDIDNTDKEGFFYTNRWVFAGVGVGLCVVSLALIPIYLTSSPGDPNDCKSYSLGTLYGGYGRLSGCNDTLNLCADSDDGRGSNAIVNCSLSSLSVRVIKLSGVPWNDFAALSRGFDFLFDHGRCISNSSAKNLNSQTTCTLEDANSYLACLPYNLSDCPNPYSIDDSFGLNNSETLHKFKLPDTFLISSNGDNSNMISHSTFAVNMLNNVSCPSMCGSCYASITESATLLFGINSLELC